MIINFLKKGEINMPEMPEIEAFKYYIKDTSLHKKIIDVQTNAKTTIKNMSFEDFKKNLKGKSFNSVKRVGKYLILEISNIDKKLVMHFGLTGTLNYTKKNQKAQYSFVTFVFKTMALSWITRRKFGGIWLVENLKDIKGLKNIGPNPLTVSQEQFITILSQHDKKNIKSLLMNQSVFSGIGNEYSDEILYQAEIDPHHKQGDLTENNLKKIYITMKDVLNYAITLRKKKSKKIDGKEFFSIEDRKFFKTKYLQAHRHIDDKCPKKNNHKLHKVKIAGRTTYYCPKHQK